MMKWLLIALVVGLALWWMARGRGRGVRSDDRSEDPSEGRSEGRSGPSSPPQVMVSCAHCGLMLPRQEASVGPDEQHFCSPEHLRLGRQPKEGSER